MMGPWAISGALLLGARLVMYEGAPDWPDAGRLWALVARHRITHFGVSPTLIRALRVHGETPVRDHDLSSLRVIGSTGEPWNPEPWRWAFDMVGGGRLPIVNYSGGTEIVGRDRRLLAPPADQGDLVQRARASGWRRTSSTRRSVGPRRGRRAGDPVTLAWDDPRLLGRTGRRAIPRDVLAGRPRHLDPRRLGGHRRRRLLVHPRTLGRHPQGGRQAGRTGRGRDLRDRPSGGGGGGGDRRPRRAEGRGDRGSFASPDRASPGTRGSPARWASSSSATWASPSVPGRRRRPGPAPGPAAARSCAASPAPPGWGWIRATPPPWRIPRRSRRSRPRGDPADFRPLRVRRGGCSVAVFGRGIRGRS